MVFERLRRINNRGFSLAELMAVIATIGILTAIGVPFFYSYWQAATLKAGALELEALLNRARQLAIQGNTTVCVAQSGTQIRFFRGTPGAAPGCGVGSTIWTGPGTNSSGFFTLTNSTQITAASANVIFTSLGAANPGGVYTARNPFTNQNLTVTVAASGRITIP